MISHGCLSQYIFVVLFLISDIVNPAYVCSWRDRVNLIATRDQLFPQAGDKGMANTICVDI